VHIQWEALEDVLCVLVTGGIGGAICGPFVADWLVRCRDRRNQKASLLKFLNVWVAEVKANRRITTAASVTLSIAGTFDERRLDLIREATPIESDIRGNKLTEFQKLVDAIINMTPGDVERDKDKL
jgi:hypothetical protein